MKPESLSFIIGNQLINNNEQGMKKDLFLLEGLEIILDIDFDLGYSRIIFNI